jgi:hypothetical protein
MLRLQKVQDDQHPTWLVSMQSTKTGELRWFPNLMSLVQFLYEEFGECEGLEVINQLTAQTFEPSLPPKTERQVTPV